MLSYEVILDIIHGVQQAFKFSWICLKNWYAHGANSQQTTKIKT